MGKHLASLRTVNRQEFEAIQCNRCGECCERFHLPGTKEQMLAWLDKDWAGPERWWVAELVELGPYGEPDEVGRQPSLFACPWLSREPGQPATCTIYSKRPATCRNFPYGGPVHGFPNCVWSDERIGLAEVGRDGQAAVYSAP
jgi:Fe-S-cluster containining protein